ncbi:lactosylceramide alpha-2,3-sialyltransferase [Cynoglossus semilaevis]|uniref:lactosylceramide alpha-2,3-sialyltransferase n=1 Tax=Cynoglossus semilaevis TaxID=244447 RepID=UPI0007DC8F96|nr:lactosylceramide alpha-2,3-sialyltransferase [Cynoglossus semilaevis]
MTRPRRLRGCLLLVLEFPGAPAEKVMKLRFQRTMHRGVFAVILVLVVVGMMMLVPRSPSNGQLIRPLELNVSLSHKKLVHQHVLQVLQGQCRRGNTRKALLARLPASSRDTQPFLWSDVGVPEELFLHQLPFGFQGVRSQIEELQKLLPEFKPQVENRSNRCQRCVVIGNGGILRGLELGPLLDRFDTVIRLNSAPLGKFSVDVGKRTSIRMSYPESTLHHWSDTDPHTLLVTVAYKWVDMSWMAAMVCSVLQSLLDRLFYWQKVPDQVPLEPENFRLLNPTVIREAALDLLKYPTPRWRLWGWDTNIPTLGVTALNLASLLCDEVSLAGFGYTMSRVAAPLHYYDDLPMNAILQQKMHNVDRETELLRSLVKEGGVSDLTGGIHCSFCSS